jgi:hypothetical protein
MIQEMNAENAAQWFEQQADYCLPNRLSMSPEEASKGLAQLALAIVNLLKEVMEKQAMRRMEKGLLNDEEIEKLGTTFFLLEERMDALKKVFGLSDQDLQIGLGHISDAG